MFILVHSSQEPRRVNMSSFLDIKDHDVRDKTIEDYLAVKKRIRQRNLSERAADLDRFDELHDTFRPVVESNERMTRDIINELTPISQGLRENAAAAAAVAPSRPKIGSKRRLVQTSYGPRTDAFIRNYINGEPDVDKMFGIRHENDNFMIGDQVVQFQGDDIVVDGEVYTGTPGLWALIVDKNPKLYDQNDYERYKELLHESHVLYRNFDPDSHYPRANRSKKWRKILSPIWDEFQRDGIAPDSDDDDEYHTSNEGDGLKMYLQQDGHCFNVRRMGTGIHFSPRPMLAGILHGSNGFFVRAGSSLYDGEGLLQDNTESPFRKIPILNWLLWLTRLSKRH